MRGECNEIGGGGHWEREMVGFVLEGNCELA